MKVLISLALLLVLTTNSSASATAPCGLLTIPTIVHINGIWTSRESAGDNLDNLQDAYGYTSPQGQPIAYQLVYNKGNSVPTLAFLKNAEADPAQAKILANAMLTGNMTGVDPNTEDALLKDYYQKVASSIAEAGAALTEVVDGIKLLLAEGPVLAVPHSQGGIITNNAFIALTKGVQPSKTFKIMGVAETAERVAGDPVVAFVDKSYVTAKEDKAISFLLPLLMAFMTDILPPNIASGASFFNGWNHDFVEIYLNEKYKARAEIKKKISLALNGLQQNGSLLVTATWNPAATGIEFHMMVNGLDSKETTGKCLVTTEPGKASYCMNFTPTTPDILFVPMVYNKGATAQEVKIATPWGTDLLWVLSTGSFSIPAMGSSIQLTRGVITKYGGTTIVIPEYTGTITLPPISTDFTLPPAQTVSTQDSLSNFGLPPLVLSLGKRI